MSRDELKIGILGFGDCGVSFVKPVLDNDPGNFITTIIDPDIYRSRFYLDEQVKKGRIPGEEAEKIRVIADLSELERGELDVLFLKDA